MAIPKFPEEYIQKAIQYITLMRVVCLTRIKA